MPRPYWWAHKFGPISNEQLLAIKLCKTGTHYHNMRRLLTDSGIYEHNSHTFTRCHSSTCSEIFFTLVNTGYIQRSEVNKRAAFLDKWRNSILKKISKKIVISIEA